MAVGAYRAIAEAGLHIPDDIAVASFNDISVAQFLNPPLTTVRLPSEEIGETAVELLLERAAGRDLSQAHHPRLRDQMARQHPSSRPVTSPDVEAPKADLRWRDDRPDGLRRPRGKNLLNACAAIFLPIT